MIEVKVGQIWCSALMTIRIDSFFEVDIPYDAVHAVVTEARTGSFQNVGNRINILISTLQEKWNLVSETVELKVGQVWRDIPTSDRPGRRLRTFVIIKLMADNYAAKAIITQTGESRSRETHYIGKTVFLSRDYFNGLEKRYELVSEAKPIESFEDVSGSPFFEWLEVARPNWRDPKVTAFELSNLMLAWNAGRKYEQEKR